ncbi:MAG: hypothetical protein ACE5E5_13430, partial [Phycisphaerae bacterium]
KAAWARAEGSLEWSQVGLGVPKITPSLDYSGRAPKPWKRILGGVKGLANLPKEALEGVGNLIQEVDRLDVIPGKPKPKEELAALTIAASATATATGGGTIEYHGPIVWMGTKERLVELFTS